MTSSDTATGARSRGLVAAARVLAWFLCVVAAVPMFGLVDLGTVFGLSDPQYLWSVPLEASWGSLFTFLVAGSYAWIGVVPDRPWPGLVLLGLVALATMTASAVFQDATPLWVAGALIASIAALHRLLRPRLAAGQLGRPPSGAWSVVVASGVPLWLGYAWLTRTAAADPQSGGDVTMGIDHWPVQAALGLAVAMGSILLLGWRSPLPLWRWAFALTAGCIAYGSLVYPERAGAMPHDLWGAAIALWGVLLAVLPGPRPRSGPA